MRDIKEIERRYKDPNRIPRRGARFFKKRYFFLLLLIIAFITNPGEDKHKEAVKHKVNSIVLSPDPVTGYIGSHPYVEQLVNNRVSCKDYYLFSITKVLWDDKELDIGFGIFGYVFISDIVDQAMREKLNRF